MKRFTIKAFSLALIASMGLYLIGCSKNKTQESAADASLYGGSATVGITQEPNCFDPHKVVAAGDREIIFNVFEGLYKFDSKGALNPCLATDVAVSSDAKTYEFTIRDGVKFHDGSDLDAGDVVYSLNRAAGLLPDQDGTALVSTLDAISNVTSDGNKVKVELDAPNSELLSYFTVGIIPEGADDIETSMIGTGPFKFDSYTIGQEVKLVRNDNYWQSDLPYLDSVSFKICSDLDAGFLELQNGSIDIFPYLTTDKTEQLDPNNFTVLSKGSNMVQIFALNNDVEPFNDIRVREAMNYALNRDDIISLTMDGAGEKLTTGMSPVMGDAYDTSLDGTFDQDIEKAKSLLKDAGYENGFEMTITVPSNYLVHVNTGVAIADQLSKVGIKAEIKQVDWATWLSDTYQGRNYQSTIIALTSDYAPYDVLSRYDSEADGNFINYRNDEFDKIIRAIPGESDDKAKIDSYHKLLALLTKDAASCYIQDPYSTCAINNRVTGYELYPMYVQDMSTVHLASK